MVTNYRCDGTPSARASPNDDISLFQHFNFNILSFFIYLFIYFGSLFRFGNSPAS